MYFCPGTAISRTKKEVVIKTLPKKPSPHVAISRKSSKTHTFAPDHFLFGRTGGKRMTANFTLNTLMINTLSG